MPQKQSPRALDVAYKQRWLWQIEKPTKIIPHFSNEWAMNEKMTDRFDLWITTHHASCFSHLLVIKFSIFVHDLVFLLIYSCLSSMVLKLASGLSFLACEKFLKQELISCPVNHSMYFWTQYVPIWTKKATCALYDITKISRRVITQFIKRN